MCLVGYSLTMPHPLHDNGNEVLSDIYFLAFGAFAGLTFILSMNDR